MLYTLLVCFCVITRKKVETFHYNIFWFIFVANNKNNWSTSKDVLTVHHTSLLEQISKPIRTLCLISMTIVKNGMNLKAVPPLSAAIVGIHSSFPPQRIFQVKISVNFIFTLNLLNKEWKWKIVLVFNFGWYPKIRSSCFNMVYFNLATYCVSYLHTMPFCRNQIPY